ncbi:hypothetical protein [Nonlabens sp. MB-3u-79]|nr:hypothetical protein [Nonlabens sp. MB-3u-79]|tara:strand:+ start:290 stop:424 length:135 start_codon:yes stop_codon:yes gene_type:complete
MRIPGPTAEIFPESKTALIVSNTRAQVSYDLKKIDCEIILPTKQ